MNKCFEKMNDLCYKKFKNFHIDFLETLRFTPWALPAGLISSNGLTTLAGPFNLSVSPNE
jgi:hypothetical protein